MKAYQDAELLKSVIKSMRARAEEMRETLKFVDYTIDPEQRDSDRRNLRDASAEITIAIMALEHLVRQIESATEAPQKITPIEPMQKEVAIKESEELKVLRSIDESLLKLTMLIDSDGKGKSSFSIK
ncbi:hypothetical protein MARILYN_44 [Vibrio phage Marilyn]|nr:hypothetical protein MARILYN_44 [Vibrio phage Marilyn]WCD55567.1 hypothetical protein FAYDEN_44 [Vibrio phage Fayden]WCD55625.1 hypothetical protein BAYBAE_45 [Vibrio phage Baybae]WCD55683.1 hypothetical protein VAITEPHAGE_44 [Vibrio phage Vaitephage]